MGPGDCLELEVNVRRLDRVQELLDKRGADIADMREIRPDRLLLILRKL